MTRDFDPVPLLARLCHQEACGQSHAFDADDCPAAQRAARSLLAQLHGVGLTVLPSAVADFVERRFGEMTTEAVPEEAPSEPRGLAWSLYHEMVRIRSRWHDGRLTYSEPMRRAMAEIMLVDFNLSHEQGVIGGLIEPAAVSLSAMFAQIGRSFTARA